MRHTQIKTAEEKGYAEIYWRRGGARAWISCSSAPSFPVKSGCFVVVVVLGGRLEAAIIINLRALVGRGAREGRQRAWSWWTGLPLRDSREGARGVWGLQWRSVNF